MSDKLNYDETISLLKGEHGLIERYWEDYVTHKDLSFVVKPSIPIIWFGNLIEYFKPDNLQVVTVAVNPSDMEFKEKTDDEPSLDVRFPGAKNLFNRFTNDKEPVDNRIVVETLWAVYNAYFIENPYKFWFNKFDKIFEYLPYPVSYYPNNSNRAIHIDCRTALATFKWKDLTKDQHDSISNKDLFKKLLYYLNPQIVIFSTKKDIFDELTDGGQQIFDLPPKKNGVPAMSRLLDDNKLFIYLKSSDWGPASGVSKTDREVFFREVFKKYSCK